ncbi:molybdenum cofactor guanylyltransferase [Segniliparus rugosus]|uniref:Probable molybdenum cofactor guanylyltransferase n=1 Tax=Segniliparus rugosus (strain ATCC BAA-974 / DSM 45345 / CCUG 50838 / CIP 108380 / JCM 13579 / CDC 945) TaxID=679197 RepID=E5XNX9_SEGRC|nr:molybdenum cofactor guanylyltransferase [Segniliparus rugosus]EFV13948.1 hypothetical protein HMPREF9336_01200 [Segniliparus rugosus ATCC BAA-974]
MAVIAGVVLAGGESRRMGSDKTQLVFDGKTLMARSFDAIRPCCSPLLAVLGSVPRAVPEDVCALYDEVPGQGPLRGLATGLAAARARGAGLAVVLSADLPLITAAVVGELLAVFEAGPAEALLASDRTSEGRARAHPLVGVYSTELAEPAGAALERGERAMMRFLDSRSIRKTQVSDPLALSNVNTPQQWASLAGLRSKA